MHPIRVLALFVLMAAAIAAAPPPPPPQPAARSWSRPFPMERASSRRTASTGTRPYPREGPPPSASTSGPASSTRPTSATPYDSPFGVPQVAADGSPSGLSADGKTLVLIRSFGPINRASLVVLGTNRLHVKNRIELEGQYSFDAIAPDGRHAYVVEYPDPFRYDRYRSESLT